MQVILEKPLDWLSSDRDGERNRLMYSSLLRCLQELELHYTEEPIKYGADFKIRKPPKDGVRLSYHSVGNVQNVWRIKETPIPYYYSIDRLGYSGWSELSIRNDLHSKFISQIDNSKAKDYCFNMAEWLRKNNLSKYRQPDTTADLPNQFIFFPMQIAKDAVAKHNKLNPLKVLLLAARYANHFNMPLVVKRHPYCRSLRTAAWVKAISLFGEKVFLTNISTNQLLPSCTAILVGNSGVGFEGLVYGKPVFSFASSEYDIAAYQICSYDDVKIIFSSPKLKPKNNSFAFVYYYLTECCFDVRSTTDVINKLTRTIKAAQEGAWIESFPIVTTGCIR